MPIVLETLEYRSDTREVIVSLDCVVRNSSDEPVDLWLTHVDNVEGRLATEDWFSLGSDAPDSRAQMISDIHAGCWNFDPKAGRLRYRDPVDVYPNSSESTGFALSAQPLSYRPEQIPSSTKRQLHSGSVDCTAEPYTVSNRSAYRLLPHPILPEGQVPKETALPYSAFSIGPITPTGNCEAIFFRLTIVIAGDAYTRLVQPVDGAKFYVYSGNRVCDEIEDFGLGRIRRRPYSDTFRSFFEDEIKSTKIEPEKYQIIICQPDNEMTDRQCVTVMPTSTRITQRTISGDRASERAMWFSAWASDFSMVLEYVAHSPNRTFRIVDRVTPTGRQFAGS